MSTTFQTLYQYAQRKLGNRSDSNAILLAKDCVNHAVRYLAERDHQYYRNRAYINIIAPFTSGTVTVANGATYCSLSSGGSWSSDYSGGMIQIGANPVAYEATITSNPARITFGESAEFGYASQASVTYSLFKYQYALPTNFRRIGDVLDDRILGALDWLDSISAFEQRRLQTHGASGQMEVACIAGDKFMVWPYSTVKQVVPLPYYRWPTDMTSNSSTMDYPDTGGNLILVRRSIDYQCAMEQGDDAKIDKTYQRLTLQQERTEAYAKRAHKGIITMGPAVGVPVRVTKIVGSDD